MIVRIKRINPWTYQPWLLAKAIAQRRDLSPAAKLLSAFYVSNFNSQSESYTQSYSVLADAFGLTISQVKRAISELARKEVIILGESAIGAHLNVEQDEAGRTEGEAK